MSYITVKHPKPCFICGKLTRHLDYGYEEYLCSPQCKEIMDKRYEEHLNKDLPEVK